MGVSLELNGAVVSYIKSYEDSELRNILMSYVTDVNTGQLTDDLIELEYEIGLYSEHSIYILGELLEFMVIDGMVGEAIVGIYQSEFIEKGYSCPEEFGIRVLEELRSR